MSDITRPDQVPPPPPEGSKKTPPPDKEKFEKEMKVDIPLSAFEKKLVEHYKFETADILMFRKLMLKMTMAQMRQQMAQYTADIKKMYQDND